MVIEAFYSSLFGDGNDGGGFQTGGNSGMNQGAVEQPGEDPFHLVCTGFDHSPWDVVGEGSSSGVHFS